MEALTWALLYIASIRFCLPFDQTPTFYIHSDSLNNINIIQTIANPHSPTLNATTAQSVFHYLSTHTTIIFQHVKGHSGHPWNELCDSLANSLTSNPSSPPHSPSPTNFPLITNFLHVLPHWWTSTLPPTSLPFPFQSHSPNITALLQTSNPPQTVSNFHVSDANPLNSLSPPPKDPKALSNNTTIQLNIISANSLTLYQHPLHHQVVETNFLPLQANIIGFQETRSPSSTKYSTDNFIILTSQASHGTGGIETWFSTTIPYTNVSNPPIANALSPPLHYFAPEHLAISSHSNQHMLVHLDTPYLHCDILNVHLPFFDPNSPNTADTAYQLIHKVLQSRSQPNRDLFLIGDFNARLGSILSPSVNSHAPETQCHNGHLFHALLQTFQLAAPSTFPIHTGPTHTWRHPATLHTTRIDYICIPTKFLESVTLSTSLPHDLVATTKEDHSPVQLIVQMTPHNTQSQYIKPPPRPICQPFHLQHPAVQQHVHKALCHPPNFPPSMDAHQHTQGINNFLRKTLNEAKHLFPEMHHAPSRPHISPPTWEAIQLKKAMLNNIQELSNLILNTHPSLPTHQLLVNTREELLLERRLHQKTIRTLLKQDKTNYLIQLSLEAQTAFTQHDHKLLYQKLNKLMQRPTRSSTARNAKPLPMLQKTDGTTTQTNFEFHQLMHAHFSQIEAGTSTTPTQLLQQTLEHNTSYPLPLHLETPSQLLDTIPTLQQLASSLRNTKLSLAPTPDKIPSHLLKLFPLQLSRILFPLTTKITLTGHEPIQWKTSYLIWLHKANQTTNTPTSYRSILLADHIPKRVHAIFRTQLLNHTQHLFTNSQLGGLPNKSTDIATLQLATFLQIGKSTATPQALLFLDIQTAFYSTVRELVIHSRTTLPQLQQMLTQQGHSTSTTAEILHNIQNTFNPHIQAISPALKHLLTEFYHNTNFTIPQTNQTTHTRQGTRAGMPLADLFFNFAMTKVLNHITDNLPQHIFDNNFKRPTPKPKPTTTTDTKCNLANTPPLSPSPTNTPPHFSNLLPISYLTWVDDLVFLINAHSNNHLLNRIKHYIATINHSFTSHGFKINFKRGKTEVLPIFRSKNTKHFYRKIHYHDQATIDIPEASIQLHTTYQYTYLGTIIDNNCNFSKEIQQRIGMVSTDLNKFIPKLTAQNKLTPQQLQNIASSIFHSKLLYNAHAWISITKKQLGKLQTFHTNIHRKLQKQTTTYTNRQTYTNDEVLSQSILLNIPMQLHYQRLLFFKRIIQHAPPQTKQLLLSHYLLQPKHSFLHIIQQSIQNFYLFHSNTQNKQPLPPPTNFQAWELHFTSTPWKSTLANIKRQAILHQQRTHQFQHFISTFNTNLQALNIKVIPTNPTAEHPSTQQPQQTQVHTCTTCNKAFPTTQQLFAHQWRQHKLLSTAHYYITSPTCLHCYKHFHTRARILRHLQLPTKQRCLDNLIANFLPLTQERVDELRLNPPLFEPPHNLPPKHIRRLPFIQTDPYSLQPPPPPPLSPLQPTSTPHSCQPNTTMPTQPIPSKTSPPNINSTSNTSQQATHIEPEYTPTTLQQWLHYPVSDQNKTNANQTFTALLHSFTQQLQSSSEETTQQHLNTLIEHVHDQLNTYTQVAALFHYIQELPDIYFETHSSQPTLFPLIQDIFAQAAEAFIHNQPTNPPTKTTANSTTSILIPTDNNPPQPQQIEEFLIEPPFHKASILQHIHPLNIYNKLFNQPTYVVAYFFSGRRRTEDIHSQLLNNHTHEHYNILPISIDLSNEYADHNNLLLSTTIQFWSTQLQQRKVQATIFAPPCETWSVARGNPYTNSNNQLCSGPPKLRNATHPQGLPFLNQKQHTQTLTGTTLLQHTILLALQAIANNALVIIEHPAQPIWAKDAEQLCSIWKLHPFHALLTLPNTQLYTFKQSIHGQITSKPTTFFIANIDKPIVTRNLYHRHTTRTNPAQTNQPFHIGLNQQKQFNTAQLKEYPPSLNKAIALMILQQIRSQHQAPQLPALCIHKLNADIIQLFSPYQLHYDDYMDTQLHMGQDYWSSTTNTTYN